MSVWKGDGVGSETGDWRYMLYPLQDRDPINPKDSDRIYRYHPPLNLRYSSPSDMDPLTVDTGT